MEKIYIISSAFEVSGRGVVVLFEGDPPVTLPLGSVTANVSISTGGHRRVRASIETARKVPSGEVLAMVFKELELQELRPGTTVSIWVE